MITTTIVDHLADPQWSTAIAQCAELSQLTGLISSAQQLSRSVSEMAEQELQLQAIVPIIERIAVTEDSVTLTINRAALAEALEMTEPDHVMSITGDEEPIEIAVAVRLQRCGKQVRFILGEVSSKTRSPDSDLVQLIRDGHRWFDDLRTGRATTIAAIARRDRQQVSHVSRNISLAFLAADITEMILTGRQPISLTPERLKAARPLPLDWNDQRALLID